ncbi:MAG: hypothetical protein C1943_04865 [Halochromatium sp.]|nr:hypothetical protein [Halochromatium sp.]
MIWALIILAITIATLLSGSVEVAKTLAVTGAIPFALVLLLQIVAFLRTLRDEERPLAAAAKTPNAANAATTSTAAVAERR